MVPRTRWLTSPTAWPCMSAALVQWSPCGWRELATTTSNCTLSTWRDSSSSSPSNFPPREGRWAPRAGVHFNTLKKPPPYHLPNSSFSIVGGLDHSVLPLSLAPFQWGNVLWTGRGRWFLDCWGAADSKARTSQAWSSGLTCSVPKNLVGATTCGHSFLMNPGLDGVCTCCSVWTHFPPSSQHPPIPRLTLSPAHFCCQCLYADLQSVSFPSSSLCFSTLPCLSFDWIFAIFKLAFCILYFIPGEGVSILHLKMQLKLQFNFFFFFNFIFQLPFRVNSTLAL